MEQRRETEVVDEDQPYHHQPGSEPDHLGSSRHRNHLFRYVTDPGSRMSLPSSCHVRVAATRVERPGLLRESVLGPPGCALASDCGRWPPDRRAQPASKRIVSSSRSKWGPNVRYTTAPVDRQAALELAHNHASGWSCPGFTDPRQTRAGLAHQRCSLLRMALWFPCSGPSTREPSPGSPEQPPPHLKDSS